jgi:aspartate kinase
MKFGGTSVATVERIRNVAAHVAREVAAGYSVAVVVSAMAGKTNELVGWVREASPLYDHAEYDVVVAAGEQVTSGLLALALKQAGIPARSWQGWQLPVRTSDGHGSARIADIESAGILGGFERGEVAVVAGFQGVHPETGRITTLGRGGSDTSAVALAAALGAERCDIYTDVDGVYTTDPRFVPRARRLDRVAFEEMLEMASLGAKVLQVRSVELAMAAPGADLCAFVLRRPGGAPIRNAHLRRGGHRGAARRHRHRVLARRGPDHAQAHRRQARASRPRSSARSPTRTSMST